jgi:hypothetical protein
MQNAGLDIDEPMEAYRVVGKAGTVKYIKRDDIDNPEALEKLKKDIRAKRYVYLHFAPPCKHWGWFNTLNGGTRSRRFPQGKRPLPRELVANKQAANVAELCRFQHDSGGYFSVENPRNSYMWDYEPMAALRPISFSVFIDQCMYKLRPIALRAGLEPGDWRLKKPTCIFTNHPNLKKLQVKCDRKHLHHECWGQVRYGGKLVRVSEHAAAYSSTLCRRWAELLASPVRE